MKFGFKSLMLGLLGSAMLGISTKSQGEPMPYAETLASLKSMGGYGSIFPRSHRADVGKTKKSNRKRLSHNAKLKRRRAK